MHIETRFHPEEIHVIDAHAAGLGIDREQALRRAVRRQAGSIVPARGFLARFRRPSRLDATALDASTIVVDEYPDGLARVVREYRRRSGCRTLFAVPRHAIAAELGYRPPTRFTERPFTG